MLKFFFRNLLTSVISIFIFLLIMFYGINILIPGDFLTPLRLMMSQEELDALRDTLGANDPLIQQYYRWIQSVFSGEITPGGFRQRSSKSVLDTVFPTLHVLIPSFIISIYLSRIPALKKSRFILLFCFCCLLAVPLFIWFYWFCLFGIPYLPIWLILFFVADSLILAYSAYLGSPYLLYFALIACVFCFASPGSTLRAWGCFAYRACSA